MIFARHQKFVRHETWLAPWGARWLAVVLITVLGWGNGEAFGEAKWNRPLPITLVFEDEGGTWFFRAAVERDPDPGWLIVDTGAAVSAFAEELMPASAVRFSLQGVTLTGVGGQATAIQSQYRLSHVNVAGVALSGWTVHGMSGTQFSALGDRRVVGIFGQDLLKRYLVCVDPRRHEVVLHDPTREPEGRGVAWMPMEPLGTLVSITLAVDGLVGRFLVDSGARVNMVFGRMASRVQMTGRSLERMKPVSMMGMGGLERGQMTVRHSLVVGPWVLKRPVMQISQRSGGVVDGIVGYPMISRVRSWWDWSRQRFGVEPYADGLEAVDDLYDYDRAELMTLMQGQGDTETVLKVCRDLRKRYPDRVELLSQEMVALQMLGRSEEAERLIGDATKAHPHNPLVWRAVANIRYQQSRWKDYLAATDQMLALGRSDEPETLRYRVEVFKTLGRWREAVEEGRRAKRLYPWSRDMAFALQGAYEAQKDWESAITLAKELATTEDPTAYLHLIRVQAAANQVDSAIETLGRLRNVLERPSFGADAPAVWARIVTALNSRPEFDRVKRHARFESIIQPPLGGE